MAVVDEAAGTIGILTLPCPQGSFPSVARHHIPALRLERTIADLFGLTAEGSPDARPWLDHGKWGVRHPLAKNPDTDFHPRRYEFLPADGESLHQIPVGPVHAGIIEPGHFRFTANGETVVRLEERLGYVHKGVEWLMTDADIETGAKLAGRVSGDSTAAYALAFARAVESACASDAPPRAHYLRGLIAELERIANHFGDIGAICNDASFPLIQAHCLVLRENVLRALDSCFGHRFARDCIVPGGMAVDLDGDGASLLRRLVNDARPKFARIVEVYDNTASLQDRTGGTGFLRLELAQRFGAGGYVGRASGRGFDARKILAYPPYDALPPEIPVLTDGDVNARVWIRIREVEQSLRLIENILDRLPEGPIRNGVAPRSGEGLSLVEGFRGDILVHVRLNDQGRIARCHLRDPSWFQWPLLEAAIEGNIVADFPLCNKSFNCSYSGHDL
jgi:Ni,Fe-hydrogenase III large subunit